MFAAGFLAFTYLNPAAYPQAAEDLIANRRWPGSFETTSNLPILIDTSPPIANLFMRADEGLMRREWKLVIDSLQRIIDDRGGTLVPHEGAIGEQGVVFESAQRRAMHLLSTLPSEGLLAYRVLYDGKAKGLFERARAAGDADGVRMVADRFLLTRSGDDAADWAASYALDQGRYSEAVARLNDILTYVPANDIPPERIYAKLYAAYTFMGFSDEAAHSLEAYRKRIAELGKGEDRSATFMAALGEDWAQSVYQRLTEAEQRGELLPRRRGGPLSPSLTGPVPWRFELTGTAADLWRRIADVHPGEPAPISRLDLVANGRQLFVRTPGGCIALDMEDLTPVWQTEGATRPRAAVVDDPRRGVLMPQIAQRPSGPYVDEPVNQISLAHELVFTIDRTGASDFLDRDEVQAGGVFFVRPGPRTLRGVGGTRLVAHDSVTGEVQWSRGRTDNADDSLANVRFLSPPLAVREQLWVPYMLGSDFFVGALRPADGTLIKNALIASIREPAQGREQLPMPDLVTPLTFKDGVVYVPTGVGALAAIDAATMRVKWTHVYDVHSGGRRSADLPSRWMASAPVVESGLVVLTPTDNDEVVGIDAAKGSRRWTASVPGCLYPIAAERGKIWLAGERVVALSLRDGSELWSMKLAGTPTGRAALCGEELHVPLSTGLICIHATSGRQTATQELPTSQAPLGNIACAGSSLFSIEPSSVRKFPDLKRMHELATQRLESNPRDIGALVQLAWSELLQGRARVAFDSVRTLSEDGLESRERMSIARVRTESLLTLAQSADSPQESLELLQNASAEDLTPGLRLRFRTAIADQLAALHRHEEAYRSLLELALSPDASELSPIDDGVRMSARVTLRSRIQEVRSRLDSPTAAKLAEEARRRVDVIAGRPEGRSDANAELAALAEVYQGTSIAPLALLALADNLLRNQEFEKAEQALTQCSREPHDKASSLTAMNRLARMYLESDQYAAGLLAESLARLEQSVSAPGDRAASSEIDMRETIERLRTALSDETQALGLASIYAEPGSERAGLALAGRAGWNYEAPPEGEPVRIVLFEGLLPRAMADRLIITGREGFVECLRLSNKETLWKTHLRLPGQFDDGFEGIRSQSVTRYGAIDGQTLVLNGPDGIFAIGALTGRLLWSRSFDRVVVDLAGAASRDRIMAAANGWVIAAPRDGYLTMMRVSDGSTVWERDLRGEPLARVWLDGDAVVFADADMKYAHILAREDGRSIARLQLRQPDPEHERVTLVVSQGMVYGPDKTAGTEAIVAYSIATGEQTWRTEVDKPIVSLFEPKAGYLGVGLLGGDVKIFDARNGETILERSDSKVRAVTSGTMWAGTLILRSMALRGPKQSIELAAFDIATGTEVWRRSDMVMLGSDENRLDIIGGVIPGLLEESKKEEGLRKAGGTRLTAYATLIDVRTGQNAGTPAELPGYGSGGSLNGDMVLCPGILALGNMKGVQGVRVELTPLPERGF